MGNIQPSCLRQPPLSPGHRRSSGVGVIDPRHSNIKEPNTRFFWRCKRNVNWPTNIESLPDGLLFNILLHLPAQHIYVASLVCRKWRRLIHTHDFVSEHDIIHHSTSCGLLIQTKYTKAPPIFMAIQHDGRIEVSKLISHQFRGHVWVGCNDLILQSGRENKRFLYIANPTTKKRLALPPIRGGVEYHSGIAFAAKSKENKVVLTYYNYYSKVARCAISTVGVDKSWRDVNIRHVPFEEFTYLFKDPLATDGFLHWVVGNTHVWTLNIETEIITQIPVLPGYGRGSHYYLPTANCISLLVEHGECLWEVWEMKPETGECRKMKYVDLEAHKLMFRKFQSRGGRPPEPVGWLKYGEVLVFCVRMQISDRVFWINLQTQETDVIKLSGAYRWDYLTFLAHRNSFVWLGGG